MPIEKISAPTALSVPDRRSATRKPSVLSTPSRPVDVRKLNARNGRSPATSRRVVRPPRKSVERRRVASSRSSGVRLSGRKASTAPAVARPRPPEAKYGKRRSQLPSTAPTAGPKLTPSPIAAPTRPMAGLRRSGSVTSATYAKIAGMAAAENRPPRTRAPSSSPKVSPSPNSTKLAAKPKSPTTIASLRPLRSETRPQNGLTTTPTAG